MIYTSIILWYCGYGFIFSSQISGHIIFILVKCHSFSFSDLITRFEKAVSVRLSETEKQIEPSKVEETKPSPAETDAVRRATSVEETEAKPVITEKNEKPEEKLPNDGLLVGSEAKEITLEGLWQGLKLKKDLHFGKISEPTWKSQKPIVTKVILSLTQSLEIYLV